MSTAQVAKRCLEFIRAEQREPDTTRPNALRAMEEAFGFRHSWFLLRDDPKPCVAHNIESKMVSDYFTYYNKTDPFIHGGGKQVVTPSLIEMDVPYDQCEFLQDFLARYGFYHIACAPVFSGESDTLADGWIAIFRPKVDGSFSRDDTEALEWVAGYISSALRRQRRADEARDYATLIEASLQQLHYGYLLLDENYRTLYANTALRDAAMQILSLNRILQQNSYNTVEALKDHIFSRLDVMHGVPARPWQLEIGPYKLYGSPLFPNSSSVNVALKRYVICVYRADETQRIEAKKLVNHYQLTKREREIVGLLQKGYSNSQIARELCISENTAKVHLRNIYAKMEVKSRSEVLATLGAFPGMNRAGDDYGMQS